MVPFKTQGPKGGDLSGLRNLQKTPQSYSINVNGTELNPSNYQLSNPILRQEVKSLYKGLVKDLGHNNFEFKITGGDRYIGSDGKIYSSSNDSWVQNSKINSKHLVGKGAKAVDIRIRGINEKMFYNVLDNQTNFNHLGIFNGITRYTRKLLYKVDRHTHIFIN